MVFVDAFDVASPTVVTAPIVDGICDIASNTDAVSWGALSWPVVVCVSDVVAGIEVVRSIVVA